MNELLLLEAERICKEWGLVIYPGRCEVCRYPLLQRKGERLPLPHCYFCNRDEETALEARALLERIQRGVAITHIGDEIYWNERRSA